MKKSTFLAFLLILGLTACGPQAKSAATLIPSQVVIASSIPPSTQTSMLTSIPTTNPSTPAPDGTATANAQWEREETEFPNCPEPLGIKRKKSPDGQWTASICESLTDESYRNTYTLHIKKQDGSKEWKVSFKDMTGYEFVGYTNSFGEQAHFISIPLPYHWYKDSRYLFVAPKAMIDSDYSDGLGLYRFDTQTGRISSFLRAGESTYNFAFSPDDEYYVYQYGLDEKSVHLVNIETGNEQTFRLPKAGSAESFLWSSDSSKFAFTSYSNNIEKNSLLLFDTKTKIFISLLEFSLRTLELNHWESDTNLILKKYEETNGSLQSYSLNVITKELYTIPRQ